MELKSPQSLTCDVPDDVLNGFYCGELSTCFIPSMSEGNYRIEVNKLALFSINLHNLLKWVNGDQLSTPLWKQFCDTAVRLFPQKFFVSDLFFTAMVIGIANFWAYGVKHTRTLIVTIEVNQTDLTNSLLQFYREKNCSGLLAFSQ